MRNGGVAVEGAFHPAFRELVDGEIYFDFLKKIKEKDGKLDIILNERLVSRVVGLKRKNLKRLGEINFTINNEISISKIIVNDVEYSNIILNERLVSRVVGLKRKNLKRLGEINFTINNEISISKIIVNDVEYSRREILERELGESYEQNNNKC